MNAPMQSLSDDELIAKFWAALECATATGEPCEAAEAEAACDEIKARLASLRSRVEDLEARSNEARESALERDL